MSLIDVDNEKYYLQDQLMTTKQGFAEVVELVDTLDLGSSAARRGSSSLLFGTIYG